MPEQDQSTTPLARQLVSFHEQEARRTLMRAAGRLSAIRAELWELHVELEGPEEVLNAIAEGERPETLAFSMQGTIECVNRDNLDAAIKSLEDAAMLSPGALRYEWEKRQEEQARIPKDRTSRGQETGDY